MMMIQQNPLSLACIDKWVHIRQQIQDPISPKIQYPIRQQIQDHILQKI